MKIAVGCLALLLTLPVAEGADSHKPYVGQSGCAAELKSPLGHYGVRLDKSQFARLEAHVFKNKTVLTIVRYRGEADKCGVVRDVIQSQQPNSSFVWECVDRAVPSAVVVGTWPANHPGVTGPAVEAWKVDLQTLKFVRLSVPVVCSAGNYAGSDQGEDLATWARLRAAKEK